jgi:integrase
VLDGQRIRVKVSAKTKAEAQTKLKAKLDERRQGVRSSGTYTVRQCVEDWLAHGLDGRSAKTKSTYREAVEPLLAILGSRTLRDLTATDVRRVLVGIAKTRSTRSVQIAHNTLTRSVQRVAAHDLVSRNVAALAEHPPGQTSGRPSKAMTRDVAVRLVQAAEADPNIGSYLILCVMTGIRPEELRRRRHSPAAVSGRRCMTTWPGRTRSASRARALTTACSASWNATPTISAARQSCAWTG